MMRASLMLVLLQCQHQVHAFQSEQRKIRTSRSTESNANWVHHATRSIERGLNWVDLNLCTDSVHANLGGLGGVNVGNTGPEDKTDDGKWKKELRYKKVATLPTGEKLDLVVTNLTEYAANPAKHAPLLVDPAIGGEGHEGRKGCLGSINIKAPGKVQLKFALVLKGTDTPAPNNYSYDFTMLDFDRSKYGMYEEVTTHKFASFVAPSIKPTVAGEHFTFASPAGAVEVANPQEGFALTGAQLNASVGFVFANVNHWKLTFKAIDSPGGIRELEVGRNIFFAGRTSLQSVGKFHKAARYAEAEAAMA